MCFSPLCHSGIHRYEHNQMLRPFRAVLPQLIDLARSTEGFSGRQLRKLPLIAHAAHIRQSRCVPVEVFFQACSMSVEALGRQKELLGT